ncbi:hypothetical protein BD626DRAFT_566241 [Schizophyllum amplum]|uniref:F-box domain-containing protein n=1 Tax=Schizophyllum amplum TaxID=97359 RepID=A0A550CR13_9AGAR|nr:hypothetical protein BD626DRAFT_566241 [Auriculariopsis ampla]
MPRVEQEVLDLIVDELDGDRKALLACASASRYLLPRAQYHIFSKISFIPPNIEKPLSEIQLKALNLELRACSIERFHALVQRTPRIASYVKELDILEGGWGALTFTKEDEHYAATWVEESSAALCDVLSRLTRVRRFSLGRWAGTFPQQLNEAIWHLLLRCPMRRVTLYDSLIPMAVVEGCPALDSMQLGCSCTLAGPVAGQAALPVCAPKSVRLRNLNVSGTWGNNSIVKSLLARFLDETSALDASSIRHLYLTLDSDDGEELSYVATLLQLCAPSLEAFEFRGAMNVEMPIETFNQYIDVGCCRRLRVVTLSCGLESPDIAADDYRDPVPAVLELLTRVQSSIEAVDLNLIPVDLGDSADAEEDVDVAESYAPYWEALDSLASPTFPRLCDVNLVFHTWGTLSREVEECIHSHMPGLSGSGRLRISY